MSFESFGYNYSFTSQKYSRLGDLF